MGVFELGGGGTGTRGVGGGGSVLTDGGEGGEREGSLSSGVRVLDIFSGSGSIGLEALSRGE